MTLAEFKAILKKVDTISFVLPDGKKIPSHFHVTEIGKISKHFIDCGGTIRLEEVINFQLWFDTDYNHRLSPEKLQNIINLSEKQLHLNDKLPIEVEYQGVTVEKYKLGFDGTNFLLQSTKTDCLAKDKCGIPTPKQKIKLSELQNNQCCEPGSNCC